MQSPLKLTIHGVDHSDALETRIRAKVQKLGAFGTDIADIALMP